jgi:hypothetical protein
MPSPLDDCVAPHPNCPNCAGAGVMDSGGFTPWDAPISIRCVCTYPEPAATQGSTTPTTSQKQV